MKIRFTVTLGKETLEGLSARGYKLPPQIIQVLTQRLQEVLDEFAEVEDAEPEEGEDDD